VPTRIVLKPVARGAIGSRAYLKFRLSGIPGRVTSAHLRLRVVTRSRRGASLFLASNRWNRASLRAHRAPAEIGSQRLRVPAARRARLVNRSVRFFVAGNGTYTFAIAGVRSVAAPALVLTAG
jgi:hypothetical protein